MPGDREVWEGRFIDAFVRKSKRPRYKKLLSKPQSRSKILDRLNHGADLDLDRAIELVGDQKSPGGLVRVLSKHKTDDRCWLMSDETELDGRLLPIRQAAELTAGAFFGTVMICPPRPIAVYRPEASEGGLFLIL